MLLFIRICINNDVPAQELRNLHFVVAEASFAGPCVLKCDVSGVCGGKPAGVRESEKCRRWSFLGRGGGVGGAGDLTVVPVLCPHPLVLSALCQTPKSSGNGSKVLT